MAIRSISLVLCGVSFFVYAASPKPIAQMEVRAMLVQGCKLSNIEQSLNFDKQSAMTQSKVDAQISNTSQSWNIRCTENIPVSIKLNSGENFLNNQWRMKHQTKNEYIPYMFYQDSSKNNEYKVGDLVHLPLITEQQSTLQFSIYAVADLNNDNQMRSAGIYKDSVAITIVW